MSRSRKLADLLDANGDVKISNLDNSTSLPLAGGAMTGAITTNSTFDTRDVATDGTKLDGIAASANNYVHPNHSGDVVSAADGAMTIQTDAVDIAMLSATGTASSTTFLRGDNSWVTPTDTDTTYSVGDGGLTQINFTSADNTKLDNIEAGADVTDATNVTAAGALMDSELAGIAAVKATTGTFLTADQSKLDAIEASADVTDATNVTAAGALMDSELAGIAAVKATTGTFLTADQTKLDAIEASADVTDATNVASAGALMKSGGAMTGSAQGSTDTDTSNTGTVTLNFSTNQNFVLTLTGAVTLANPTTEVVGQSGFITFIQDGTGGRVVSLGTDYETAAAAGLTLSTAASATDIVPYVVVAAGRILLGTPQLAFA